MEQHPQQHEMKKTLVKGSVGSEKELQRTEKHEREGSQPNL